MVSKIIFHSNYQIIEKKPVRVLTPIQCNETKKKKKNTGNHKEEEGII